MTGAMPPPGPRTPPAEDLIVVGGGPAGLARAFWERRANPAIRLRVLEAEGHAGGWMQTEECEGFLLERGPQTVRGTPETDAIVEALDLVDDLRLASPEAKIRWLARKNRLRKLPSGPVGLLFGSFLPTAARLRMLCEPLISAPRSAPESESVATFVTRRLGRGAVPLVQAIVSGIYAGDVDRLEVAAALPLFAELERDHGGLLRGMLARGRKRRRGELPATRHRGIIGFERGLQELTDALVRHIGADRIETGDTVTSLQEHEEGWLICTAEGAHYTARRIVLAVPAVEAAKLLRPLAAEVAEQLAQQRRASLVTVWFGYPLDDPSGAPARHNPRMSGFGFLQHGEEPGPLLGCLYTSRLFPTHAPPGQGLLRAMLGGSRFGDELIRQSDDEIRTIADSRLRALIHYEGPWSFSAVRRAVDAVPQFDLGHRARLQRIRAQLAERFSDRPLELIGNSYDSVALPAQLARRDVGALASGATTP